MKIIKAIFLFTLILLFLIKYNLFALDKLIELPSYEEVRPKIGLALSGGGARGISQIGVLKFFEKNKITIDYISGTSIGAIIGGMYACGYNAKELEDLIINNNWEETISLSSNKRSELFIDQREIYDKSIISLRLKNFSLIPPEAISSGNPFDSFIQEIFWGASYQPETNFNNLKIPFRAVATDLVTGKTVSFSNGNLSKVIRASATIPLRYTPVRIDTMILVDGGILSNIPVEALEEFKPDIKVAVNTTSPLLEKDKLNTAWNHADQVVSIAMKIFSEKSIDKADVIIEPNLSDRLNSDFSNLLPLIGVGYQSVINQKENFYKIYNEKLANNINNFLKKINYEDIIFPLDVVLEINNDELKNIINNRFTKISSIDELKKLLQVCILNRSKNNYIIEISDNNLIIKNNSKFIIKNIEINSQLDSLEELKKIIINNYNNKEFSEQTKKEIIDSIYYYLRKKNYHFIKVDTVFFEKNTLKIGILDSKLHNIMITGTEVSEFIIKRDLEIEPNKELKVSNLLDSWQNLVNTDLFSEVELLPYRDSEKKLNVLIKLKDGGTQSIKLSGRVDSERNSQAGIFFIQENLLNIGSRLNFGFTICDSYLKSNLILENSRFFNTSLNFNSELYYNTWKGFQYTHNYDKAEDKFSRERNLNFDVERYGLILGSGLQIARDGSFYSRIRFEQQKYNNINDTLKKDFYPISTIKFGMFWDNIDDKYFPRKGRLIDLSVESNLIQNPDFVGFTKVFFKYVSYNSIGKHTSGLSLLFGAADNNMPYPEFFFLGGQDNFFGLMEQELGGRQILKGSLEYLYKLPIDIFFDTYFYARYDIGNVWANQEEIRLVELRQGIGFGLSINTPVGPAKLSYGKNFSFLKNNKNNFVFPSVIYFSIGMELN